MPGRTADRSVAKLRDTPLGATQVAGGESARSHPDGVGHADGAEHDVRAPHPVVVFALDRGRGMSIVQRRHHGAGGRVHTPSRVAPPVPGARGSGHDSVFGTRTSIRYERPPTDGVSESRRLLHGGDDACSVDDEPRRERMRTRERAFKASRTSIRYGRLPTDGASRAVDFVGRSCCPGPSAPGVWVDSSPPFFRFRELP